MKVLVFALMFLFCLVSISFAQRNVFPIPIPDTSQDGDVIWEEIQSFYHWYYLAPDSNYLPLRVYMERSQYGIPDVAMIPIETITVDGVSATLIFINDIENPGWYLLGKAQLFGNWYYYLDGISYMFGHYY